MKEQTAPDTEELESGIATRVSSVHSSNSGTKAIRLH